MALTKEAVITALSGTTDLVDRGLVGKVTACDGHVHITLTAAGLESDAEKQKAKNAAEHAVKTLAQRTGDALLGLLVEFASTQPRTVSLQQAGKDGGRPAGSAGASGAGASASASHNATQQSAAPNLPGVKHVIAVGAGKGGVGKSTVAVNLAVGLALRGHSVGILDGDIYGPSLPTMLGLDSMQTNIIANMLQPFYVHGVKAMTIGKLVDPEKPLIWRGPMAHGAFKQLLEQTEWGGLDYLIVDLPPGTGDVSLTMAQLMKLTGAVVVCTPQVVAQDDAVRAVRMFQQLGIEVLGVVENMSYFVAEDLSPPREYDLFGRGGAEQMAQRLGVPYLGGLPITVALRKNSDDGNPSANYQGSTRLSAALEQLVTNFEGQVALAGMRAGAVRPTLTIS
jgi:ATP-binding protein involved in chromosome partitioning